MTSEQKRQKIAQLESVLDQRTASAVDFFESMPFAVGPISDLLCNKDFAGMRELPESVLHVISNLANLGMGIVLRSMAEREIVREETK